MRPLRIKTGEAYWTAIFDDEEIARIVSVGMAAAQEDGTIRSSEDIVPDVRKSTVAWLYRAEDTDWIFDRVQRAAHRLNSSFFGFDLDPLQSLQFTRYPPEGGHYTWHWDLNYRDDNLETLDFVQQRKLSCVVQLSDPSDYEGGELEIAPCGNIIQVKKEKAMLTAFPSFVNHRVLPVTSGERISLVAWFEGPDFR